MKILKALNVVFLMSSVVWMSGCFNSPVVDAPEVGNDTTADLSNRDVSNDSKSDAVSVDICSAANLCGEIVAGDDVISCPDCVGGNLCVDNRCECPSPECDATSCNVLTSMCGASTDCGICSAVDTCIDNECVCVPTTCADLGANCGTLPDGCGGELMCGECNGFCGGNGPNVCGPTPCVPDTCASRNVNCGQVGDGCGVTLECGACTAPETCGALNANVCGCVPQTDAEFCAVNGSECGPTMAADNCGVSRTVDCGTCSGFDSCVGNQCECIPESNSELCASNAPTCGPSTLVDRCGNVKSITCGCSFGVCYQSECCLRRRCKNTDCGDYPDGCGGMVTCGMEPCP